MAGVARHIVLLSRQGIIDTATVNQMEQAKFVREIAQQVH
jgi:hypothetical protein